MTVVAKGAPSTIASWTATLLRALAGEGADAERLAREAGIDPNALAETDARVPREALTRLWALAVAATGDPAFGLTAARYGSPTTLHALGYAMLASANMREAFERLIRFRRLIGDVIELRLTAGDDRYRFVIDVSAPPGAPAEAVDTIVATTVRWARFLSGRRDLRPVAVELERARPADVRPYERALGVSVRFGAPENALEFARDDFDARLPSANAELARQNDAVAVGYLARLERATISRRVQSALIDALPDGVPSKDAIARALAVSTRTLQRQLAGEGTSFKELLDEARVSLARSYVEEGRLSVTEIAFVLGFADTSTFSRAFKRWTGRSPREHARGGRGRSR